MYYTTMIIGESLLKICLLINSQLRFIAKSLYISYAQLIILLNIPAAGISLSNLSNNIGIDNSTLTRNIEKIITQKLIFINQHEEDKRQKIIMLSELGFNYQRSIENKFSEFIKQKISKDIDLNSLTIFDEMISSIIWRLELHKNDDE